MKSPGKHPNPADAGCNSQLAEYSNTPGRKASRSDAGGPILHHSARPDSRTRTTTRTRTKRLTSGDPEVFGAEPWISSRALTSGATFRAPLRLTDPGLKPWAMMFNRFAVNPTRT